MLLKGRIAIRALRSEAMSRICKEIEVVSMWLSMTQPFNLVPMAKHYMRPHKRCNYDLTKYKTNLKRIYSVMEPRQQK